jgi:hypothetical protein
MHARIFQSADLITPQLSALLVCLLASMQRSTAQQSATFEEIRGTSPDGEFAVRISCSGEAEIPLLPSLWPPLFDRQ